MKIAIYVEGQTELIFIREVLLKWYEYDAAKVGIKCMELRNSAPFETEYSFGNEDSERFYLIVNVGGDSRALSKALDNAPKHRNIGFSKILVLRDMYSKEYVSAQSKRIIDPELNNRFINGVKTSIKAKNLEGYVHCFFAIMEIEAWLLGMGWYLDSFDNRLNSKELIEKLKLDIDADPEITEFHPALRLKRIYNHIGSNYDKHAAEINSIMSNITKQDITKLLTSGKCNSFKMFIENLTTDNS